MCESVYELYLCLWLVLMQKLSSELQAAAAAALAAAALVAALAHYGTKALPSLFLSNVSALPVHTCELCSLKNLLACTVRAYPDSYTCSCVYLCRFFSGETGQYQPLLAAPYDAATGVCLE
jgi:hypothetical protein